MTSSVYVMVALQLTALVVVGSIFALVVSRVRKRGTRAATSNMLLAAVTASITYAWFWVFISAPILGALVAVLAIAATALFIVRTRSSWSEVRADCAVAVAFLATMLGALAVVG